MFSAPSTNSLTAANINDNIHDTHTTTGWSLPSSQDRNATPKAHAQSRRAYFPSSDEYETDSSPAPQAVNAVSLSNFPFRGTIAIPPIVLKKESKAQRLGRRPCGLHKTHTPTHRNATRPTCLLANGSAQPLDSLLVDPHSETLYPCTAFPPRDYCLRTHAARTQVPDTRVLCPAATDDSKAKRQKQTIASKQHSHCATFRVLPPAGRSLSRGRGATAEKRGSKFQAFGFPILRHSPAPSLF